MYCSKCGNDWHTGACDPVALNAMNGSLGPYLKEILNHYPNKPPGQDPPPSYGTVMIDAAIRDFPESTDRAWRIRVTRRVQGTGEVSLHWEGEIPIGIAKCESHADADPRQWALKVAVQEALRSWRDAGYLPQDRV